MALDGHELCEKYCNYAFWESSHHIMPSFEVLWLIVSEKSSMLKFSSTHWHQMNPNAIHRCVDSPCFANSSRSAVLAQIPKFAQIIAPDNFGLSCRVFGVYNFEKPYTQYHWAKYQVSVSNTVLRKCNVKFFRPFSALIMAPYHLWPLHYASKLSAINLSNYFIFFTTTVSCLCSIVWEKKLCLSFWALYAKIVDFCAMFTNIFRCVYNTIMMNVSFTKTALLPQGSLPCRVCTVPRMALQDLFSCSSQQGQNLFSSFASSFRTDL